ncbi:hypothetical protein ACWCPQ_34485 [Nocardia sp. NPDC001965]
MSWTDRTDCHSPDCEPALCADTSYDIPKFMALFKGRTRFGYGTDADGRVIYRVLGGVTEAMSGSIDHVHVMDRRQLELVDVQAPRDWPESLNGPRPAELRSSIDVKPFAIVEVTMYDFPHPTNDYET